MADHTIFVGNAVAAVHVARHPGDIERLAAVVALQQRDGFRCQALFIHQAATGQRRTQAQRDLGLHVGQLLLDQLRCCQRPTELLAIQRVLPGGVPAPFGGPHRAPGNAEARVVEATERAGEPFDAFQDALFGQMHIGQHDLARDTGPQGEFAFDLGRGKASIAAFDDEAADLVVLALGPHHRDIGERGVGDPHLGARKQPAALHLPGAGLHAGRIGTGVRLGQAEATDEFAAGQARKIALTLGFGAIGIDRIHHEGRLHTHGRTIGRIHPLHLARDQAIGHVRSTGAAITLDGGAEQAGSAEFLHQRRIERLVAVGEFHHRHQFGIAEGARRIAHHCLFFGQLAGQQQRVFPIELRPLGRKMLNISGSGGGHD